MISEIRKEIWPDSDVVVIVVVCMERPTEKRFGWLEKYRMRLAIGDFWSVEESGSWRIKNVREV